VFQNPTSYGPGLSRTPASTTLKVMARPPSYDRDEVIRAAERQFRHKRYNGTTVDDIAASTGLAEAASTPLSATSTACSCGPWRRTLPGLSTQP